MNSFLPEAVFDLHKKISSSIMFVGKLLSVGMWIPLLFDAVLEEHTYEPWTMLIAALLTIVLAYNLSWLGVGLLIGRYLLGGG